MGKNIWADISEKRIYRWQRSTWKSIIIITRQGNANWNHSGVSLHTWSMTKIKKVITPNAGEDTDKLGHSCTAAGNVKWHKHSGKPFGKFLQN